MTSAIGTISVTNWDDFQHYRDRDPPWIKLYRDILTSEPWLMGTDCSRLVQIAIMLLAARYKNAIPADPELIRKASNLDHPISDIWTSIEKLVSLKFIKIHGFESKPNGKDSAVLADCYSEKERSEKGRSEQRQNNIHLELEASPSATSKVGPIEEIFEFWKFLWNKPRSKLDPKRRSYIVNALKTYDVKAITDCISGYRHSPHHMGHNDRNTVYDEISLFLRDAAHIDAGITHFTNQQRPKYRRAKTVEELETEEKNAKH